LIPETETSWLPSLVTGIERNFSMLKKFRRLNNTTKIEKQKGP
jgi:hypothetical protein